MIGAGLPGGADRNGPADGSTNGAPNGSTGERFLVTGALGCIGAWTVRTLVAGGTSVVAFDMAGDPKRLRLIMSERELAKVTFVRGDITDRDAIGRALDEHGITHLIHLAALQVPFARADPPLGALVNVVGTVNVLEAAKRHAGLRGPVVYTSSIGMFEAADADAADGRLHVDATAHPRTHYGVYKLANEGNARVYWLDDGLSSVGLRPLTVYGPGRDQGLTSGPTKAILAAVVGRPYRIAFGGRTLLQYAEDVARALIAAGRSGLTGARVFNLGGSLVGIDDLVATIERCVPEATGLVTHDPEPLPFPDAIDDAGIEAIGEVPVTPLDEAVRRTVEVFRRSLDRGSLVPEEHGLEPVATTS
ncbi:MAG: NAD(P)-dependent oxidoreductase [Chloroflexi bacterium]|nr:MAG: NAD(P)-dependent oxidoreductase [Chloroflexota bacterium]